MQKNNLNHYLRVGTTLYRHVPKPLLSRKAEYMLLPWNVETIKQDHPNNWKEIIRDVDRYNGFCTIPEHQHYQRNYQGFYNIYDPIAYQPEPGNCDTTLQFIRHIFGEQYELGLDYLQLLYMRPLQRLPVLCLVSEERETGKTTFLNLLKAIYGNNMTFNTNDDFRSNFNADWVSKLIIVIDEVLLDKKEDSEKIKNLSTARTYKSEAKGKDRFEVEFFGKIILCSNNEDNFMVIGQHETRYWVRKIGKLTSQDPLAGAKLEKEIPALLHVLYHRSLSTTNQSRMWFTPEQIATDALKKVKSEYINRVELELYELIKEIMEIKELDAFSFINQNAKTLLDRSGIKIPRSRIRKILEERWGLKQYPHASNFTTYQFDGSGILYEYEAKGRYYSIQKQEMDQIFHRMLT